MTTLRFRRGETAIIIARADEISTGCRFEFEKRSRVREGKTEVESCCYTSRLGLKDDLCLATAVETMICRDNSSYLVEEVIFLHFQNIDPD